MKASLFFLLLLFFLTFLRVIFQPQLLGFKDGEMIQTTLRINDSPIISNGKQSFDIEIPGKGKLKVITSQFPRLWYGEEIVLSGTVTRRVIDNERIVNTTYFPHITVAPKDMVFFLTGGIKERVESSFRASLPPISSALMMGIVFGGKQGMPTDFVDKLQTTGVMHVVAASGMNVTLLAGFLLSLLTRLTSRKKAIIFTMVALVWYAFLAGMEPSIVRASVMALFAFSAVLLGRQQQGLWILLLTACVMLLIAPSLLIDVGFQLSFAATLGIILLKPLMSKKAKDQSILSLFKDDLTSTLAAQITTLPLLLIYFQSIGLLSVIINLLILWTIPPIMVIGAIAAFVGLLVPFFGGIIAFISLPFLLYFELIIKATAVINPVVTFATIPLALTFGYYLLLLSVVLAKMYRRVIQ